MICCKWRRWLKWCEWIDDVNSNLVVACERYKLDKIAGNFGIQCVFKVEESKGKVLFKNNTKYFMALRKSNEKNSWELHTNWEADKSLRTVVKKERRHRASLKFARSISHTKIVILFHKFVAWDYTAIVAVFPFSSTTLVNALVWYDITVDRRRWWWW